MPVQLSPIVRLARPEDALAISRLYSHEYKPANGGAARDFYPFPQFLDPDALERVLGSSTVCWFVVESNCQVIGTCGALFNIGTPNDRIAECFGLVIQEDWRFKQYGTALFKSLCNHLTENEGAIFIIAETRTAHPGGWKIVRHCNFVPIGFEPYAHLTPAGFETMLLTGRVSSTALEQRNIRANTSPKARRLSEPLLRELNTVPLSCRVSLGCKDFEPYPTSSMIEANRVRLLEVASGFRVPQPRETYYKVKVDEDDSPNEITEKLGQLSHNKAGIVSLQRLEGDDVKGMRYRRRHFMARLDNQVLGYVSAICDNRDRRFRILELRSVVDGIQGFIIYSIVRKITKEAADSLTVVLDARADNVAFHASLENIGFFPTVYYPALVSEGDCRVDVVQFTYLHNLDFEESCKPADFRDWPLASTVRSRISE